MELPFVTLDVFTKTRFKGNPLAVVTIPADLPAPPSQAQKQAIAREFNLSETVFVHDVPDSAAGNDVNHERRIDIFLTNMEIPFAGHPTIGAAVELLHNRGVPLRRVLAKAGAIDIAQVGDDAVSAGIPHNMRVHEKRVGDLQDLKALGIELSEDPTIRQAELNAPVVSIVNGMAFVLVELPDLEHLAKVRGTRWDLATVELLDDGWRSGFMGPYYYVRTGGGDDVVSLRTRLILAAEEDPATGSAASALTGYLSLQGAATAGDAERNIKYEVTQGVEMGRESNILVDVGVKAGKVDTITLSGTATRVMSGTVTI